MNEKPQPSPGRPRGFKLAALFFVTTVCAVELAIVRTIGGQIGAFSLSVMGLASLTYCMLSVASGHSGTSSKLSLCLSAFLLSLAIMTALIEAQIVLDLFFDL